MQNGFNDWLEESSIDRIAEETAKIQLHLITHPEIGLKVPKFFLLAGEHKDLKHQLVTSYAHIKGLEPTIIPIKYFSGNPVEGTYELLQRLYYPVKKEKVLYFQDADKYVFDGWRQINNDDMELRIGFVNLIDVLNPDNHSTFFDVSKNELSGVALRISPSTKYFTRKE